jgi:hypothetical protein
MDPMPTSSKFANLAHGADTIDWTGGRVANGTSVDFTFSIDVPDSADIPNLTVSINIGYYVRFFNLFMRDDERTGAL